MLESKDGIISNYYGTIGANLDCPRQIRVYGPPNPGFLDYGSIDI